MNRSLKLIRRTLEYAVGWAGPKFYKLNFKNTVGYKHWPKEVIEKVRRVLDLPQGERQRLLDAFKNDITFGDNIEDAGFRFKLREDQLTAATFAAGQALLVSFYEEMIGSTGGIRGLPGQAKGSKLTRKTLEEGYRAANRICKDICPACLDTLPEWAKDQTQVDREHALPKADYPSLSIHPLNLPLTCMPCNQRTHHDDDPIDDHTASPLLRIFHPFLRSALGENEADDKIDLEFNHGRRTIVTLRAKGGDPNGDVRVTNFDKCYAVSTKWSSRLEVILSTFVNRITARGQASVHTVRDVLQEEVNAASLGRLTIRDQYLSGKYAKWLLAHGVAVVLATVEQRQRERARRPAS
jgi:hypothetical protein